MEACAAYLVKSRVKSCPTLTSGIRKYVAPACIRLASIFSNPDFLLSQPRRQKNLIPVVLCKHLLTYLRYGGSDMAWLRLHNTHALLCTSPATYCSKNKYSLH